MLSLRKDIDQQVFLTKVFFLFFRKGELYKDMQWKQNKSSNKEPPAKLKPWYQKNDKLRNDPLENTKICFYLVRSDW